MIFEMLIPCVEIDRRYPLRRHRFEWAPQMSPTLRKVKQICSKTINPNQCESVLFPNPLNSHFNYVYTIDQDAGTFALWKRSTVDGALMPLMLEASLADICSMSSLPYFRWLLAIKTSLPNPWSWRKPAPAIWLGPCVIEYSATLTYECDGASTTIFLRLCLSMALLAWWSYDVTSWELCIQCIR